MALVMMRAARDSGWGLAARGSWRFLSDPALTVSFFIGNGAMIKDLSLFMRKAQEMQKKIGDMRAHLEQMEITGESGGGMVKVVCNGNGVARRVDIAPDLFNTNDKGTVEDLIAAAINNARDKTRQKMREAMDEMGMPMSGDMPASFPFGG